MTEMTQDTPVTDEEMEEQLPVPVGYRLLIALPKIEETYDSGIVKADRRAPKPN